MDKNYKLKITNLPTSPGVYIFKDKVGDILYIGKAASLKSRVKSYFGKNLAYERPIEFAMDQVTGFEVKRTDSVVEAYFLEQELIKKHQPKYNVLGKDDKSFVYVCITKEDFPRFEIKRKTDLYKNQKSNFKNQNDNAKYKNSEKVKSEIESLYSRIYGPYGARHQVETALRILRRIFPYHNKKQQTEKGCLDYQIGLCPGPYKGMITKTEYAGNISGIEMIFKGKKKMLTRRLEKEMIGLAKKQEFEKAAERRNQIFALNHIQDVAMIKSEKGALNVPNKFLRIEAYDISNISGKFCVGSMVVFDNSKGEFESNKSQYRKFKIRTVEGIDDVAATKEVLERRFQNDWQFPSLVVLDGGKGHLNMAVKLFVQLKIKIPIITIAKGPTRKISNFKFQISPYQFATGQANQFQISKNQKQLIQKIVGDKNILWRIISEAHRFAITYHRKLRRGQK